MFKDNLRRVMLPAFLLAVLLVLAGCGSAPTPTPAPTGAQMTGTPAQAPTEAPSPIEPTV